MTAQEVEALVELELSTFDFEPPPRKAGLLDNPWSSERLVAGVEALRAALVAPHPTSLAIRLAPGASGTVIREAWVVAVTMGLLVVYDVDADEYALADPHGEGVATDINVRGDLVGTFLAA